MNSFDHFNLVMVAIRLDANKLIENFTDARNELANELISNPTVAKRLVDKYAFKFAIISNECKIIVKMVDDECDTLLKYNVDVLHILGFDYYNMCSNIVSDVQRIYAFCNDYIINNAKSVPRGQAVKRPDIEHMNF